MLSHSSAAALFGWLRRWTEPFEVTVATDRRPKNIRVHRSRWLEWRDCTRQLGIPVTTPARTLLDCAPALSDARLKRLASDALHSDYLSPGDLAELLARCDQRAGARRLERYALGLERPTRSEFEDRFVAFTERFGLPRPEINVHLEGREVDAFFRAEGVIVELDGYKFHASPAAFERDRDHDAEAVLNGLVTVRITWDRLTRKASTEAERLHAILQKRRLERNLG